VKREKFWAAAKIFFQKQTSLLSYLGCPRSQWMAQLLQFTHDLW